jgi:hypothetical protein
MKIIGKICYSSIILGGVDSFYYGECSKVGFHSSKAPQVNATNQNHHLTNKYNNKAIYMCQLDPSPHSKIFCMLAKNLLPNKK